MPTGILTSLEHLEAYLAARSLALSQQERLSISSAKFPLRLPVHYANLIDWSDPNDPLKKIALPQVEEQTVQPYELTDPIGDENREAVPGLIHRYPNRALLLLTTYCHIHCRFCFRREVVGKTRPADFK
jgi:lysine 2,3-aminomutase